MTLSTTAIFKKTWTASRVVDPHDEQGAEPISGVERQPIAPNDKQGKEDDDERRADEPQLLTDDGEDEVVLFLR